MSAGYQVFNANGIEIINSNDPMLFVLANGTNAPGVFGTSIPYSGWPEPPILLIRPRPGVWLGGFTLRYTSANSAYLEVGDQGYDWALCVSSKSGLIQPIGKSGLEVYDATGKITFSSNIPFARIVNILTIKGPYSTTGAPINTSASIVGFSQMPWIMMRDAGTSFPFPSNGDGATFEQFLISVNSNFTIMSARLTDSLAAQYNPFQNGNMYFPLCLIPGL